MKPAEILKKYGAILFIAILIVIFYKTFDQSVFNAILSAFFPVIIGGVLAYFLQPLVQGLENRLDNMNNQFLKKYSHTLSTMIVFLSFVFIIVMLMIFLIPKIFNYAVVFAKNITGYVDEFEKSMTAYFGDTIISEVLINTEKTMVDTSKAVRSIDPSVLLSTVSKTGSTVLTILLGLIFCPYILLEAKHLANIFDRFMLLFICQENLDLIHEYTYKSHCIFGSFIYGKFIDSSIIGVIALIGLGILKLDYFPLLAFIIFVTNMIPYFGPFIGGVPVAFIALLTGGLMSGIYTAIFIFVLQQFDGLILGPAILGDTVGISPFWIICSITVFGSLFGFIGMFLGVPLICVIRMFFNDFINYQNNKKVNDS